jgi:hypothetical protein
MHNIDAANNPMKVLDDGEEQLRTKTNSTIIQMQET